MSAVPEYAEADVRPVDRKRFGFIHRHLRQAGAQRIVELGCGPGRILRTLEDFPDVIGVDTSAEDVSRCRAMGLNARVASALEFRDGAPYDAVIASEIIEHVLRPDQLLANAAANLAPGGLLVLTTPNGFGFYELRSRHLNPAAYLIRWNAVRRLLGRPAYVKGSGWDHCQWFTLRRLLRLAADAGFHLLEHENSDFISGGARDVALASKLPAWAASGWFFAFRYDPVGPTA
jgi:2-polyprenyl-3-methyl-5-hydroxy-6-metoxy-1,4-benzoquinol methylase